MKGAVSALALQGPRTKPDRAVCRLEVGWGPQCGEQMMEFWGEGKDTVTQFFFQAWSAKVPRVAQGIPENPLSECF